MVLAAIALAAALRAETFCETPRTEGPEGASAITHVSRDVYFCVDDRGGWLHEVTVTVGEGEVTFKTNRVVHLDGRKDLEGCAYDHLTRNVWVSDEVDNSIRAYDPSTGRQVAALAIPDVYRRNVRKYHSFEGLAISPDGLCLYTANEENLKCDATNVVRIQEFARKGADDAFRPSRQFAVRLVRDKNAFKNLRAAKASALLGRVSSFAQNLKDVIARFALEAIVQFRIAVNERNLVGRLAFRVLREKLANLRKFFARLLELLPQNRDFVLQGDVGGAKGRNLLLLLLLDSAQRRNHLVLLGLVRRQ